MTKVKVSLRSIFYIKSTKFLNPPKADHFSSLFIMSIINFGLHLKLPLKLGLLRLRRIEPVKMEFYLFG